MAVAIHAPRGQMPGRAFDSRAVLRVIIVHLTVAALSGDEYTVGMATC